MTQPTLPTRLLFDPSKDTQHQYVPAAATDIRMTFLRVMANQSELSSKLVASIADAKARKARK